MNDQRWGFDDVDDGEYEELGGAGAPPEPDVPLDEETLVGQDADGIVEVVVSLEAEVRAVRLSPHWQRFLDPRALHTNVVSAANAATMRALAHHVEHPAPAPAPPAPGPVDESRLTNQDVTRLLDAADAQLRQFTAQLSAVADQQVSSRSAAGHVEGSGLRGQVLSLDIDDSWAGQVRTGEIEDELTEVLRGLHHASSPGELAAGPQGGAVAELMALAADPVLLMRRLGLPADGPTNK